MLPETVSSGIGVVFLGLSNDDNIPLRSSGGQSQEKGNENHLQDVKQQFNHKKKEQMKSSRIPKGMIYSIIYIAFNDIIYNDV